MNFLLEVTDYTKPIESFAERLGLGGFILLLGISVVFAVLIVIWATLAIFKLYFSKYEAPAEATELLSVTETVKKPSEDAEIVAVIAAAIAAAEADSDGVKFRVVSFRRK